VTRVTSSRIRLKESSVGPLNNLDIAIIVGSLVLVVVLGLYVSPRQDDTARGYFLAGRKMPWWLIGPSFVATGISSEQMVGTVGMTYQQGMGIANWELFALPSYTLVMLLFIPAYLANRITTVPEYFSKRFGPLCGDIYSWVLLVVYVFVYMVTVLYSGSLVFAEITGWSFSFVLALTVILVGLYTIKGGLASVMWTDTLQCLLLVVGGAVLYFAALAHVDGGWRAMVAAAPERYHLYQSPKHPWAPFLGMVFASFGMFLFYQAGSQVMIQRMLGARSTWDGIMGLIFAALINMLRPFITCFLGLVVWHWIFVMHRAAPLADKDQAFPVALRTLAPEWGARGIVLAGFLAAVMSTLSSLINSTATMFSFDIYKKMIHRNAGEREMVRVGQASALAVLVIAACLAPMVKQFGGIFQFFQTAMTYIACPFMATFLMGLLWKRTNYAGGLFGLIGGLLIQLLVVFGLPHLTGVQLHIFYNGFIAQVLIMAGIAVVSALTALNDPAQEAYVWRKSWLHFDEAASRPFWQQLSLWYGLYAFVWVGVYILFW
jgi:SSS family solute:Na+ symporter